MRKRCVPGPFSSSPQRAWGRGYIPVRCHPRLTDHFFQAVYTEAPPTYVTIPGQRSCTRVHGSDNQDNIAVYFCLYFFNVHPIAVSNDRNDENNDEITHCYLHT